MSCYEYSWNQKSGKSPRAFIRQREHVMGFGLLLFESSVSHFLKTQLLFDDTEYVLHFGTDRRLFVFHFLCRALTALAQLL